MWWGCLVCATHVEHAQPRLQVHEQRQKNAFRGHPGAISAMTIRFLGKGGQVGWHAVSCLQVSGSRRSMPSPSCRCFGGLCSAIRTRVRNQAWPEGWHNVQ